MDKVGRKCEPQAGAYALGTAKPIVWAQWSTIITRLLCDRCMNIECATEAMLVNNDM
jgi:DNA-binding transcriptional regulator YdaS (Cro superfamily)